MDVSKIRGTPKSSILKEFSIINHPFWDTTIFGNTYMAHHYEVREQTNPLAIKNRWGHHRPQAKPLKNPLLRPPAILALIRMKRGKVHLWNYVYQASILYVKIQCISYRYMVCIKSSFKKKTLQQNCVPKKPFRMYT